MIWGGPLLYILLYHGLAFGLSDSHSNSPKSHPTPASESELMIPGKSGPDGKTGIR